MIRINTYGEFEGNGMYAKGLATGKILKVCISSEFTTARIKMYTSDNELFLDTGNEIKDIYYPFNILEHLSDGPPRTDYFYTNEHVYITIEGLGEGESIEYVRIYVEE